MNFDIDLEKAIVLTREYQRLRNPKMCFIHRHMKIIALFLASFYSLSIFFESDNQFKINGEPSLAFALSIIILIAIPLLTAFAYTVLKVIISPIIERPINSLKNAPEEVWGKRSVEIKDDYFSEKTPLSETKYPLNKIEEVVETESAFFYMGGKNRLVGLTPKSASPVPIFDPKSSN